MSEKKKFERKSLEEREAEMITITDKYLVAVSKYDYQVRERGNEGAIAYFGKFENALLYIRDDMIRNGLTENARNLEDTIKIITDIDDRFEGIIASAFPEYELRRLK